VIWGIPPVLELEVWLEVWLEVVSVLEDSSALDDALLLPTAEVPRVVEATPVDVAVGAVSPPVPVVSSESFSAPAVMVTGRMREE
jgi:hypothetical protein